MASKLAEGTPFEIHVRGSVTGKTWSGKFRARPLLTFRHQMNVDKLRREFAGTAEGAIPEVVITASVLAELAYRLTETPEWWKESQGGLDLCDPNVVEDVWKQAKKVETDHIAAIETEGKAAVEALREVKEK